MSTHAVVVANVEIVNDLYRKGTRPRDVGISAKLTRSLFTEDLHHFVVGRC